MASLAIIALTAGLSVAGATSPAPMVARADIMWSDPANRTTFTEVHVPELMQAAVGDRFVLLDTAGTVATLEVVRVGKTAGACLGQATFRVVGAIDHVPRDSHVVVVGPLAGAQPKARLLFLGLAVAGHAASEPAEPLGLAPPPGGDPTYAVDLDGDGKADLLIRRREQHGPFVKGSAKVQHYEEQWRRERKWSRTRACTWTSIDTIR